MSEVTTDPRQFVWVEKYRPQTVDECILPQSTKDTVKGYLSQGRLQTILLCGSAGTGKTTLAKAICNEIGADWIMINGSVDGGIDTLKVKITQFASTISFSDAKKVVIIDEADRLSAAFQEGARSFFEEFTANCTFILTCNYRGRIIDAIQSRCAVFDFKVPNAEKPKIAMQFMKRVCQILELEGIEYEKAVIAELVQRHFPDFRKCLNELQKYSASGKIDTGILVNMGEESFNKIVGALKSSKYNDMRKWVADHSDLDSTRIFRMFYDKATEAMDPKGIPDLVLLIGQYQYRASLVADQEINVSAFFTEIMYNENIVWK